MKTNHRFAVLALALILVFSLCFTACGQSKNSASGSYAAAPAAAPMPAASYDSKADAAYYETPQMAAEEAYAESVSGGFAPAAGANSAQVPSSEAVDMSEKIIYNADVTLETTEFDSALEKIAAMIREMGGYMESTSVSGSNYSSISRGNAGTRTAYYVIRVPSVHFSELTGALSEIGNVPYSYTYTRNVTTQYYDTQSRLNAYRVQEGRLLEMLAIAETVDDMLAIQRELTNVQYEIDSLTGTLRYYDNQVGYSTVNLNVSEVKEYTPEPTVKLSYWERMSRGFKDSLKSTSRFFTDLFLWFVTSLPWLIPLAAVVVLLIALLRRRLRRDPDRAARRAARKEARALKRAEKKAKKGAKTPEAPASREE